MKRKRRSSYTPEVQRLTPIEVAQLWFRRGADYADQIAVAHPDFPAPGPDGLYLAEQVKAWFDRWHGQSTRYELDDDAVALQIARGRTLCG